MPCKIVRDDITLMHVDAIVNTTNHRLYPEGGGVASAIYRAAGPGFLEECLSLAPCDDGEVKVSGGYNLPCKYVFHTVAPAWRGGDYNEATRLSACYTHALEAAVERGCADIAIPLLSAGAHGFPTDLALAIANTAIRGFLMERIPEDDLTVYLVVFTRESVTAGSWMFREICEYIDDNYVAGHYDERRERGRRLSFGRLHDNISSADRLYSIDPRSFRSSRREDVREDSICLSDDADYPEPTAAEPCFAPMAAHLTEDDMKKFVDRTIDESFSQMLMRKLVEKGIPNTECYKRANIDKKLFSKIIGKLDYQPKKTTAFALAVGLKLSLRETEDFLNKAGYAISHSSRLDIIVEYFIKRGEYDVLAINEMLFAFDQPLLGANMN